ncbi:DEAD/DEAH box helicase family protein [Pedobacter psychroterrae]|uniref:Uncharacterized protein n=1 Tax=Pedobacter psychroterrae TaxID=2530453 RepID=A0A4R0NFH1_9SPHI|nr:DEAD/DEAH box helicase family protein [Pedobacter psychroterrae]TCC98043.1 hypothetical protein EZ437_19555 [Pedobacter psychroterrae]
MKTLTLDIPYQMNFTDLLHHHKFNGLIPANWIINKRIPGIGTTYNEIMSQRHSIIIVPFTAIIEVKKVGHGDRLCVIYGQSNIDEAIEEIGRYLADARYPHKKIMTTPESFYKVKAALSKQVPGYINEYFMLIDECNILVEDALFRKNMLRIMDEFFLFNKRSMISATPLIPTDTRFIDHDFKHLKFEPKYDFQEDIHLVVTNNINASCRNLLDSLKRLNDKPILIFTNCKKTITYLAKRENINENYKIFCSKSLTNFFQQQGLENVFDSVAEQQYARYNFFTSKFFSGVDILIPEKDKPHVIMISNIKHAPHSIISPTVTAIQIYGRSRAKVSSITHITTILETEIQNEKEIKHNIDKSIYHLNKLQELRDKSYEKATKKMLSDVADKDDLNLVFQDDGTVNSYFRDNHLFSVLTRNLYCNSQSLVKQYRIDGFFRPYLTEIYEPLTEEDLIKLVKLKTKKKSIEVLKQLENLIKGQGSYQLGINHEDYFVYLGELYTADPLICEAYFKIGAKEIRRLNFNRKKLRNILFDLRQGDQKNNMRMIDEILLSFRLETPIYIDEIEKKLTDVYVAFNFQRKPGKIAKASATDIEDYFDCKRINGKKKIEGVYKTYYILYSPKFKISEESLQLR